MTQISLETPEIGKPDKTEDPKIITCFTTIQTAINGNLDSTNLKPASVTGESLDASVTGRRLIANEKGYLPEGTVAGTYLFVGTGEMRKAGVAGAGAWGITYINPTPYKVVGKSNTLIQIEGLVVVNGTAPTSTYGLGLLPVTSLTGSTNMIVGVGTSVLNTGLVTAPSAGGGGAMESSTAAAPTGSYCLAMAVTGTMAANSFVVVDASLYVLNT